MANEISVTASLSCFKTSVMSSTVGKAKSASFTMSGNYVIDGTVTIATSATAIPLGSITSPHYCFVYNTDSTNYVTIRNGSGGADVIRLNAGEFAIFPWSTSATPYAVANTASVVLEYLLLSA